MDASHLPNIWRGKARGRGMPGRTRQEPKPGKVQFSRFDVEKAPETKTDPSRGRGRGSTEASTFKQIRHDRTFGHLNEEDRKKYQDGLDRILSETELVVTSVIGDSNCIPTAIASQVPSSTNEQSPSQQDIRNELADEFLKAQTDSPDDPLIIALAMEGAESIRSDKEWLDAQSSAMLTARKYNKNVVHIFPDQNHEPVVQVFKPDMTIEHDFEAGGNAIYLIHDGYGHYNAARPNITILPRPQQPVLQTKSVTAQHPLANQPPASPQVGDITILPRPQQPVLQTKSVTAQHPLANQPPASPQVGDITILPRPQQPVLQTKSVTAQHPLANQPPASPQVGDIRILPRPQQSVLQTKSVTAQHPLANQPPASPQVGDTREASKKDSVLPIKYEASQKPEQPIHHSNLLLSDSETTESDISAEETITNFTEPCQSEQRNKKIEEQLSTACEAIESSSHSERHPRKWFSLIDFHYDKAMLMTSPSDKSLQNKIYIRLQPYFEQVFIMQLKLTEKGIKECNGRPYIDDLEKILAKMDLIAKTIMQHCSVVLTSKAE